MTRLTVEVWSDIACPWCYIGKRRLEAAIGRLPAGAGKDAVDVVWRAFELDPGAPRVRDASVPYAERLAKKYGMPLEEAHASLRRMTDLASRDGLDFHFERVQAGNTFDAHRVIHLAHERGVQDAVKERFLRAYMTEGEPIGEPEVLARLASEAGLEAADVRITLASDAYSREVRADEEQARTLGISGVPFFVIDRRYAVSGAQSADVLLGALSQAWAAKPQVPIEEGAVCGPEGC